MTKKETVERNIGLTFDFVNYLAENPKEAESLPGDFKLEFIEKDFAKTEKKKSRTEESKMKSQYVRVKNTFEFS